MGIYRDEFFPDTILVATDATSFLSNLRITENGRIAFRTQAIDAITTVDGRQYDLKGGGHGLCIGANAFHQKLGSPDVWLSATHQGRVGSIKSPIAEVTLDCPRDRLIAGETVRMDFGAAAQAAQQRIQPPAGAGSIIRVSALHKPST